MLVHLANLSVASSLSILRRIRMRPLPLMCPCIVGLFVLLLAVSFSYLIIACTCILFDGGRVFKGASFALFGIIAQVCAPTGRKNPPLTMKQLTILVTPLNAVGHVGACAGALAPLLRRGHRIIFVLEETFAGKVAALGFTEHLMVFPKPVDVVNPGEDPAKSLLEAKVIGNYSPYEKFENMLGMLFGEKFSSDNRIMDGAIKEAIKLYKPDLIYFDACHMYPAVHYSGIPWVKHISTTPLYYILDDAVPPGCSGLPFEGDIEEARKFNALRHGYFYTKQYNDLVESLGYPRFPDDQLFPESQALTVYGTPDELDWDFVRAKGWFNLEVFNKNEQREVIDLKELLPKDFLDDSLDGAWSGKWIYVSMGSMGSVDLPLMRQLVKVLGETKHKYIFSKGPRHEEYSLAANMWGDRFLPQTKIVPLMDLVITHGGNNTVTETFIEGKPMIVLPLFGDQFDNAQRLQETGLGARVHPYEFTNEEMIGKINGLLDDKDLNERLQKAARRIQHSNKHQELANKIESMFP